jgi:hypothetical protein
MAIYVTQVIYLHPGQEEAFQQFEDVALPTLARYNGQLLLRIRPTKETFIGGSLENPYEMHLVVFATEEDLQGFMQDDTRKRFLHLKEQSIRSALLIQGTVS